MSDNITTVTIEALDTTFEFDVDLLNCPVCTNQFDGEFVTYACDHSFCSACEVELGDKCALCRAPKGNVVTQNVWVRAAVLNALQTLPCGEEVQGCVAATKHLAACFACSQVKIRELVLECKQFQKDRDASDEELQLVASELAAAERQSEYYKQAYESETVDAAAFEARYYKGVTHINNLMRQNNELRQEMQELRDEKEAREEETEDSKAPRSSKRKRRKVATTPTPSRVSRRLF